MTTAVAPAFRRDLPEHITVAVDGMLTDLDAGDPCPDERPVGRVVVTMPAFVADALAHSLAKSWQVNQLFDGNIEIGVTERTLAEALLAAAEASGCPCREGGLRLPPDDVCR
jgi:hypothetical protein